MPWLPLRAARTATLYTWRYGGSVPDVSRREQWRQQCQLRIQHRSSFDPYYRYRLDQPDRLAEAPAFVELNEIIALRTWLYDRLPANREDLKDKRRFYRRAVAAGLPTPAVLATVSGGRILEAPSRLPDQDLFTKEAHALNVRGATYWVRRNEGTYVSSSGQNVAHGAFLEHLAAQSSAAPFVVQPRLQSSCGSALVDGGTLYGSRDDHVSAGRATHAAARMLAHADGPRRRR